MNPKLLRLYLVTDPGYLPHPRVLALLPGLVEAGVTLVQLRDKQADTRTLLDLAKAYLSVLRPRGVPLIVNDRADVAVASGADGVHVGTSDLPAAAVRALTGSNAIVGVSVEQPSLPDQETMAAASYLAASPVFSTPTKTDTAPALGLDGVRTLASTSPIPVVGIGGLHADNAGALRATGAAGAAVVSAILAADDPIAATRNLSVRVRSAPQEHAP